MNNRFLIDTNIFLWHMEDDPSLPKGYRSIIDNIDVEIWVSIVSFWEITIKTARGDLEQIGDFDEFVNVKFVSTGFHVLPIRIDHLVTLRRLPFYHKDPFDRLIIAQSLTEKLPLLHTDEKFEKYFSV